MNYAIITDTQQNAGAVVKELRREQGLTLRELSARSGVSESGISRWENGERVPNVDAYIRIIKALDAEVVILRKARRGGSVPASEEG